MAETFDITAAIPTPRLEGQTVVTYMEVAGFTKPHGIGFMVEVRKQPGWQEAAKRLAEAEAAELESVFDL